MNECGLALRGRFGFPGEQCADESPMAELDGAILMPRVPQDVPEPSLPQPEPPTPAARGGKPSASDRSAPEIDAAPAQHGPSAGEKPAPEAAGESAVAEPQDALPELAR